MEPEEPNHQEKDESKEISIDYNLFSGLEDSFQISGFNLGELQLADSRMQPSTMEDLMVNDERPENRSQGYFAEHIFAEKEVNVLKNNNVTKHIYSLYFHLEKEYQ